MVTTVCITRTVIKPNYAKAILQIRNIIPQSSFGISVLIYFAI